MPIYAYKCEACGHAQDVLQKMSDPLLTACPACGAPVFKKQLTAAGFQLKGSGWYATDFKGGAPAAPAADKPAENQDKAAKPAETKTESVKPADSPAAAPSASKSEP